MNEQARNPIVHAPHIFEEMKTYAHFGDDDSRELTALYAVVKDEIPSLVDAFYDRIDEHEETRNIVEAHSSRERLSATLSKWTVDFLRGPHDQTYYEKRCKIGHVHMKIGLPPHFVFTALTLLRNRLAEFASSTQAAAMHRLMDIELAIINQVYWGAVTATLQRAERLATIGELGGSLAHEIRNPLAAMQNAAFLLQSRIGGRNPVFKNISRRWSGRLKSALGS